jgi:hypothetical protein
VHPQSTLQRQLRRQILKNTRYSYLRSKISGNFVPTRCITIENPRPTFFVNSFENSTISILYVFFFFLIVAFPLSSLLALRSACFSSLFSLCAAVLRGTFPGHPRPPSLLLSGQHNTNTTQHPWEAHPAWDLNPADLAVVSEECRSSFHHPTVSP